MSCCGNQRRSIGGSGATGRPASAGSRPGVATLRTTTELEYVGPTALSVVGPATGRRYHFPRPGARLAVALPDRWGLLQVPGLREA